VLPNVDHWLLAKTTNVLRTIVLDWFSAELTTTKSAKTLAAAG
jgi:hypothetical protein